MQYKASRSSQIYTYLSPTLKLYIVLNGQNNKNHGEGKYESMGKIKMRGWGFPWYRYIFDHASGVTLAI